MLITVKLGGHVQDLVSPGFMSLEGIQYSHVFAYDSSGVLESDSQELQL